MCTDYSSDDFDVLNWCHHYDLLRPVIEHRFWPSVIISIQQNKTSGSGRRGRYISVPWTGECKECRNYSFYIPWVNEKPNHRDIYFTYIFLWTKSIDISVDDTVCLPQSSLNVLTRPCMVGGFTFFCFPKPQYFEYVQEL